MSEEVLLSKWQAAKGKLEAAGQAIDECDCNCHKCPDCGNAYCVKSEFRKPLQESLRHILREKNVNNLLSYYPFSSSSSSREAF